MCLIPIKQIISHIHTNKDTNKHINYNTYITFYYMLVFFIIINKFIFIINKQNILKGHMSYMPLY